MVQRVANWSPRQPVGQATEHFIYLFSLLLERKGGEREREVESERERERGRDINMREKLDRFLPPTTTLSQDRTHNLSVYETALQPIDPHQPGHHRTF